jgi:hypothetical protein
MPEAHIDRSILLRFVALSLWGHSGSFPLMPINFTANESLIESLKIRRIFTHTLCKRRTQTDLNATVSRAVQHKNVDM